jgi:hypothetical protein
VVGFNKPRTDHEIRANVRARLFVHKFDPPVCRPTLIKEPPMAFAVSQNRSNASLTPSTEASGEPGGALRAAPLTQSFDDLADRRIALGRKVSRR